VSRCCLCHLTYSASVALQSVVRLGERLVAMRFCIRSCLLAAVTSSATVPDTTLLIGTVDSVVFSRAASGRVDICMVRCSFRPCLFLTK
jgi:hypothetical protein